ncbi:F-box protein CPR1 [Linum perenne]
MSGHIPIEIITSILDRIAGVKDLVRWRRVSKQWLALIDSHDFIQRHLQRSSESSSSSTTSKLGLFVGSISRSKYGFGYDQLSDDYKLVIILQNRAEIHRVRAKSCRTVYNIPPDELLFEPKGVFACGALHWIDYAMDASVCAFDLGSETVSELSLPDFDARNLDARELGVVDLCLCFGLMDECSDQVDVWMMKEYGNKGSWFRIYKIDLSFIKYKDCSVELVCFPRKSNEGQFLFLLNKRKLVWFDPESNRAAEEDMKVSDIADDHYAGLDAFYWLDSLVKIYPDRRMEEEEEADDKSLKVWSESSRRNSRRI